MLATKRLTWLISGILAALALAGCAGDPLGPGTIAKHYRRANPDLTSFATWLGLTN